MTTSAQTSAPVWTIRPVEAGDAGAVARLFEATFGKPVSEAWYRWKVLNAPWPIDAPPAWIAVAGDRVIGHYGGTALRLRLGSDQLRIVNSCDAMTAPDFRRQGVLTALAEAAARAWAEAGAAFVIGLMTAQWGSRREHLNHRDVFRLGWRWRPVRDEAFVPRRAGVTAPLLRLGGGVAVKAWDLAYPERYGAGVTVDNVERPGPEFDYLWDKLSGSYEASIVRDRAWVAYRFAKSPAVRYHVLLARHDREPVGYLSYRLIPTPRGYTGWIVDMFTAPEDDAARATLISAALARLRRAGARDARAFAAPGSPVLRSLRLSGFLRRRHSYDVTIIPLRDELPWDLLRNPRRWLFAIADSDVL